MPNSGKMMTRTMTCENCQREWVATKDHWRCPYCGLGGRCYGRGHSANEETTQRGWGNYKAAKAWIAKEEAR